MKEYRMRPTLLLILSCAATFAHAASNDAIPNAPGPHAVGLRIVQQYDYTRSFRPATDLYTGAARSGESARPIQAMMWYPAQREGRAVAYGDYVRSAATEEDFVQAPAAAASFTESFLKSNGQGSTVERLQAEMARPMQAHRDARPAAGKFPLVIYAPSLSASAFENAELCEYLASQGYVVMASASIGSHQRSMEPNLEGAESQAGDIAFLIGQAHALPQVDMGQIAVVGFSWGGLANVLAAAKDQRIRALVALDGSMRGYPHFLNGNGNAESARYATPARVAVPLLYVSAQPKSIEQLAGNYDVSFSFINAMRYSDVYYLTMHPMVHANFSTVGAHLAGDGEFVDYSRAEVTTAHNWTSRYVLEFLNGYLKKDSKALAYVATAPLKNGAPRHMASLEVRRAQADAPTPDAFSLKLHAQGFSHAVELYGANKQLDPKFSLSESMLNYWGYKLLGSGRKQDGLEIFKLAVHIYPDSGNIHDSLAEAYAANNDKTLAIKHYQRSLVLDPKNTNAVRELKALGVVAAPQ